MALLGTNYSSQVISYDYQLKHNFEVAFYSGSVNNREKDISFLVRSVDLDHDKLEFLTLPTGLKFLEKVTFAEEISIIFMETTNSIVKKFINDWIDLNYDNKKKVFISYPSVQIKRNAGAYKNIRVNMVDQADNNVAYYEFYDCIPKGLGGNSFSSDDPNPLELTIAFSFNGYHIEYLQ